MSKVEITVNGKATSADVDQRADNTPNHLVTERGGANFEAKQR